MRITNKLNVSYVMAAWLLHDEYDGRNSASEVTATGLLKSVRQAVLRSRLTAADMEMDVSDLIASRMGTAYHDSIEKALRASGKRNFLKLGLDPAMVDKVRWDPTEEELQADPEIIPAWFEKRTVRELDGFQVSGKFDLVFAGELYDFKSTSVWSWVHGNKDKDYQFQGSVYRWLNPDLILGDQIHIQFLFTDWSRAESKRKANYPASRIMERSIDLLPVRETEARIRERLRLIRENWNLGEAWLPRCTDEELWRRPTRYKVYANHESQRASKDCGEDKAEAFKVKAEMNAKSLQKGKRPEAEVREIPGEPRACEYCPAFPICTQKDSYYAA